ncbi:hypothetical protein TNCV_2054091 [Trichonephila clavipes]|nr:hypothetical protein TNCV_2054091 [Trichonephila clavipes]
MFVGKGGVWWKEWRGMFVFPSSPLWSRQQRVFAVKAYFSYGWSVIAVRTFSRHFNITPGSCAPNWKCVLKWILSNEEFLQRKGRFFEDRFVKFVVYKSRSKTLEDLQNNIRAQMDNIPIELLEKVNYSFRSRLHQCIDNRV